LVIKTTNYFTGIAENIADLIHRIWTNQPWFKKFLEDMAEIAAGVVIGAAVATFITSGGWIAILAAGAISAGMNHYDDKIIIEAGDKF
jgi:phage-related minor tail protein